MSYLPDDEVRVCVMCGRAEGEMSPDGPVAFRNQYAIHCTDCDQRRKDYRKTYARLYHQARGRALSRLAEAHAEEFELYLVEERKRVDTQLVEAEREKRNG